MMAVAAYLIGALWIGGFAGEAVAMFETPPKLSPFTRVDFREDGAVEVMFEGRRYEWLAFEGRDVSELQRVARVAFPLRHEKRLSEDLVQVLWLLGVRPEGTVSLKLKDVKTDEVREIAAAPMTEENRSALYLARHPELVRNNKWERLSPFTRVDFPEDGLPLVTFEGKQYEWLAIEGSEVPEIMNVAREHFPRVPEKRVAEDIVEVLGLMGKQTGKTVSLRLKDLGTGEVREVTAAAMTAENRQAVWTARNAGEAAK